MEKAQDAETRHAQTHYIQSAQSYHVEPRRSARDAFAILTGHSDGSVTAIYNRYGYVKEMRATLERWAQQLTAGSEQASGMARLVTPDLDGREQQHQREHPRVRENTLSLVMQE